MKAFARWLTTKNHSAFDVALMFFFFSVIVERGWGWHLLWLVPAMVGLLIVGVVVHHIIEIYGASK